MNSVNTSLWFGESQKIIVQIFCFVKTFKYHNRNKYKIENSSSLSAVCPVLYSDEIPGQAFVQLPFLEDLDHDEELIDNKDEDVEIKDVRLYGICMGWIIWHDILGYQKSFQTRCIMCGWEQIVFKMLRSGLWTLVILNKGQTMIWEKIEIYSQEKVYTIKRLLIDKNTGLVNTE